LRKIFDVEERVRKKKEHKESPKYEAQKDGEDAKACKSMEDAKAQKFLQVEATHKSVEEKNKRSEDGAHKVVDEQRK
jgi:hypothetical protein